MLFFDNMALYAKKALQAASVVISIASGITAILPNPSPQASQALIVAHNILDVIALNINQNSQQDIQLPSALQGNNHAPSN